MCMNCGCGEPDKRHKDSDTVREDIEQAARGQDASTEQTVRNLQTSLGQMESSGSASSGSMANG